MSWLAALLPYLEYAQVFKQLDQDRAWDAEENRAPTQAVVAVARCPAHVAPPTHTSYVGLAGVGLTAVVLPKESPRAGVFGNDRRIRLADITDGTSNTAAVIETAADNGPWAAGGVTTVRGLDAAETAYVGLGRAFGLKHKTDLFRTNPVVANTALADGSVRTLSDSIAPEVLRALATIAGGEKQWNPEP